MLKLLATDFDGTSIGNAPRESCTAMLASALEKIKRDNILWAICTGRDFLYCLEGLEYFNPPVQPDFIMTSERYIYYRDQKKGWQGFTHWNQQCDFLHEELFKKNGSFFEEVKNLLACYQGEITFLENDRGIPEMLLADDEHLLNELALELHSFLPASFSFQRSRIHLRFCHEYYDKGRVLAELSNFLSLTPENILAIGDHYNDLSMLDGRVAKMVACPANAHHEVKAIVKKANGYISSYEAGEGTADAIRFFN